MMVDNELPRKIIGLSMEIHKSLGAGLLESVYRECLYHKILESDIYAEKEKPIPLVYEGVKLDCGYRIDILVEQKLILEIKSVEAINDVYLAQLLTYMKLGKYELGLLINFNVIRLKDGIRRLINTPI